MYNTTKTPEANKTHTGLATNSTLSIESSPRAEPAQSSVHEVQKGAVLHQFDLRPPLLVLGQAQSEGKPMGKYTRMDTNEVLDSIKVCPILIQAARTKWPAGGFTRSSKPECWSVNGVTAGSGAKYEGRECFKCEFFTAVPWSAEDRREMCQANYLTVLVDMESLSVYLWRLSGVATRVARTLAAKGVFRQSIVTLASELRTNDKGKFYVPTVKVEGKLEEADQNIIKELIKEYSALDFAQALSAEEDQSKLVEITLSEDPDMRYSANGLAITTLHAVPVKPSESDGPPRRYVLFSGLAEKANSELRKNLSIQAIGREQEREWIDSRGEKQRVLEFIIESYEIIGAPQKDTSRTPAPQATTPNKEGRQPASVGTTSTLPVYVLVPPSYLQETNGLRRVRLLVQPTGPNAIGKPASTGQPAFTATAIADIAVRMDAQGVKLNSHLEITGVFETGVEGRQFIISAFKLLDGSSPVSEIAKAAEEHISQAEPNKASQHKRGRPRGKKEGVSEEELPF